MNSLPSGLLRQKREQAGLTPEEVVGELKKRGFSINVKTLYGYENGVSTPRVNVFIALCDIYRISDIMGEFGYSSPLKLAAGDNEWSYDLYNDFFNAPLLEKIFILLREGIPSFAGYEEQLEKSLPSDAAAANFNRLYTLFASLDEAGQECALQLMEELVHQRFPPVTESDLNRFLISASSNSPRGVLDRISPIFRDLNQEGQERLLDYADDLVSSGKYKKDYPFELGEKKV